MAAPKDDGMKNDELFSYPSDIWMVSYIYELSTPTLLFQI